MGQTIESGGRGGRPRYRRGNAGFTLVELMIAIGVLMIAVLGAFRTQIAAHNLLASASETNTAMADLQAAMEEIMLLPIDAIPVTGAYPPGVAIADFNGLHLAAESIVPSYPGFAGGDVPDPLEVQLTITWNDYAGRARRLTLASMKTR